MNNNLANVTTGVPTIPTIPMNNPGNTRMILTTVNIAGIWVSAGLAMWGGYRACKEIQERQIVDPKQRALIFAKWGVPAILTGGITTWAAVTNYRISNEQILAASSTALLLKEKAQKQLEQKKEQEKKAAEEANAKTVGEVTKEAASKVETLDPTTPATDDTVYWWYDPYVNQYYHASENQIQLALTRMTKDAYERGSSSEWWFIPYTDYLDHLADIVADAQIPDLSRKLGWRQNDCDVYVYPSKEWRTDPYGKPARILKLSIEPHMDQETPFDK